MEEPLLGTPPPGAAPGAPELTRSTSNFERVRSPGAELYVEPYCLDSAQAHMALRLSGLYLGDWLFSVVKSMNSVQLYDVSYCKSNPSMSAPCLVIDGKVINGVDEILKYLLEKYPGKVEKQLKKDGREAELLSFCDLATRARKGPDQPDQRLCRIGVLEAGACWGPGVREHALRRSYLKARQNPELEELQDCYLREIVKVRVKDSLGGYRTEGNAPAGEEKLQELLDAAEAVLEGSGTAFLFGEDPCMADACMAPIIFRLNYLYRNRLKRVFRKHPAVSWYWDRLRCLPETRKAVISPAKAAGFVQAWAALCPYRLYLALKLGGNFDGAKLPDEQETHVQEACEVACAAKVKESAQEEGTAQEAAAVFMEDHETDSETDTDTDTDDDMQGFGLAIPLISRLF